MLEVFVRDGNNHDNEYENDQQGDLARKKHRQKMSFCILGGDWRRSNLHFGTLYVGSEIASSLAEPRSCNDPTKRGPSHAECGYILLTASLLTS